MITQKAHTHTPFVVLYSKERRIKSDVKQMGIIKDKKTCLCNIKRQQELQQHIHTHTHILTNY